MSQRPDAPLIAHLAATHGRDCALLWQERPYCLLPAQGFTEYLWDQQVELTALLPEVAELPWPDVTLDYATARAVFNRRVFNATGLAAALPDEFMERGRCWLRLCDGRTYLNQPGASPWLHGPVDLLAPYRANPDAWLVIEAWESLTARPGEVTGQRGLPHYPDVSFVSRRDPWNPQRLGHLYPNPQCRVGRNPGPGFCHITRCQFDVHDPRRIQCTASDFMMSPGVLMGLLTMAYLLQCDEYLVEVTPLMTPAQSKQNAKAIARRPELRQDLPHWILLDPQRAHDYGHPSGAGYRGPYASERASPRAHTRRGHWRVLRAERYTKKRGERIWMKPMWVGDDEWVAEGQRYKVLPPHGL